MTRRSRASVASITSNLNALVAELRELRAVRSEHEALLAALDGIDLGSISGARGGGGRPAGRGASGVVAALRSSRRIPKPGKKRYRATKAELFAQYARLCKHAPAEWRSREAICKAAGIPVSHCESAFKLMVRGGKGPEGKHVKAVLEANGKVGRAGAYRRA